MYLWVCVCVYVCIYVYMRKKKVYNQKNEIRIEYEMQISYIELKSIESAYDFLLDDNNVKYF